MQDAVNRPEIYGIPNKNNKPNRNDMCLRERNTSDTKLENILTRFINKRSSEMVPPGTRKIVIFRGYR